jgi:hypothetical protein
MIVENGHPFRLLRPYVTFYGRKSRLIKEGDSNPEKGKDLIDRVSSLEGDFDKN